MNQERQALSIHLKQCPPPAIDGSLAKELTYDRTTLVTIVVNPGSNSASHHHHHHGDLKPLHDHAGFVHLQEPRRMPQDALTLNDLVRVIEDEIRLHDGPLTLEKKDAIHQALVAFDGNLTELAPYLYFDRSRNYTRNLVATDHVSYSLIILCWNKGKYSPIHDHPSDGCWIRHLQGIVNEVRYEMKGESLVETLNMFITDGVSYMDDSLGLHKVGNPSEDIDAITLHLYTPPFDQCRLWHDPDDAANPTIGHCMYDSEYGDY